MSSPGLVPAVAADQVPAEFGPEIKTRTGAPRSKLPRGLGWLTSPLPDRYKPWRGRATRADKLLMTAFTGLLVFGLATKPLKPFLLASHPVALELLTGDLISIGAAAAFARVGEGTLWLVVAAGAIGMVKFDWLMWWAGRAWGEGMIRMVTTGERAQRFAARATELNPWVVGLFVAAAVLPGIPSPVVYAMAGITGMRLTTFLALDLVGALVMTGLVAGIGYELGQSAVDVVLVVDRYASILSIAIISTTLAIPWLRRKLRRRAADTAHDRDQ
jgi:membrane protein DedA with SNARE-associated domain